MIKITPRQITIGLHARFVIFITPRGAQLWTRRNVWTVGG
jgi:hypothetical protein